MLDRGNATWHGMLQHSSRGQGGIQERYSLRYVTSRVSYHHKANAANRGTPGKAQTGMENVCRLSPPTELCPGLTAIPCIPHPLAPLPGVSAQGKRQLQSRSKMPIVSSSSS